MGWSGLSCHSEQWQDWWGVFCLAQPRYWEVDSGWLVIWSWVGERSKSSPIGDGRMLAWFFGKVRSFV